MARSPDITDEGLIRLLENSHSLIHVESLDLGPHCSNAILERMADEQVLPKLKHLAMARSTDVTDEGLLSFLINPNQRALLKSLDITFCHGTTYGVTFLLIDGLAALEFIWRLPPWMDGQARFDSGALHVRWPDGTFALFDENGGLNSCSYMMNLFEHGGHVIC